MYTAYVIERTSQSRWYTSRQGFSASHPINASHYEDKEDAVVIARRIIDSYKSTMGEDIVDDVLISEITVHVETVHSEEFKDVVNNC